VTDAFPKGSRDASPVRLAHPSTHRRRTLRYPCTSRGRAREQTVELSDHRPIVRLETRCHQGRQPRLRGQDLRESSTSPRLFRQQRLACGQHQLRLGSGVLTTPAMTATRRAGQPADECPAANAPATITETLAPRPTSRGGSPSRPSRQGLASDGAARVSALSGNPFPGNGSGSRLCTVLPPRSSRPPLSFASKRPYEDRVRIECSVIIGGVHRRIARQVCALWVAQAWAEPSCAPSS
jgi:hypothetical protein